MVWFADYVEGVSGRVWGFFGFNRCWQLLAKDAQMSEYLRELLFELPVISLCASCSDRMFEWFRILWSKVFGWMLVLLECAL